MLIGIAEYIKITEFSDDVGLYGAMTLI